METKRTSSAIKAHKFPGYTALSDQVYVKEADADAGPPRPDEPTVLLIYGWGDSLPRHITKYTVGFQALFPRSKTVVVLSPMLNAIFSTPEYRALCMCPVIEAIFGPQDSPTPRDHGEERILVQAMSNSGGINFASTLHAYRTIYPGMGSARPFPHRLLVCDSTPGSTNFGTNVARWSRAMAVGLGGWMPWPFFISQAIFASVLGVNHGLEKLRGVDSAAVISCGAVLDPGLCDRSARRLYMYSKEDEIIGWEDIEHNAKLAKEQGYETDMELFEGSLHVGHMRLHPEQYWAAIERNWKAAMAGSSD